MGIRCFYGFQYNTCGECNPGGGGGGVLPCIGHIDMPLYSLSGVLAPYWFETGIHFVWNPNKEERKRHAH